MTITPEISVAIAFAIFVILVLWKGTRKITEGLDKRAEQADDGEGAARGGQEC